MVVEDTDAPVKRAPGAAIGAISWGLRVSSASIDVSDTMEGAATRAT